MFEPVRLALTATPSMRPSSSDLTWPVRLTGSCPGSWNAPPQDDTANAATTMITDLQFSINTSLWRSLLFANQVRIVFFVFADRFDQFLICHKIQASKFDGPRSCIRLWVFNGDFQIDVPKVAARVAFDDVGRFGLGMPIHVEPSLIIKAASFDDQAIALPPANRVTVVGRLARLRERTAIHEDLAVLVICLEENRNDLRRLDNLAGRGNGIEIRHAVSEATLGWMPVLQVLLPLFVGRFCCGQQGNFNSIRTQVLKIFVAVPDRPDARQIGLAVRSLRCRSREVRFSVRSPRNPRCGIVLPLCGEWDVHPEKNDQSRDGSRNRHTNLLRQENRISELSGFGIKTEPTLVVGNVY